MSDSVRHAFETWGRRLGGAAMTALWLAGCQAPTAKQVDATTAEADAQACDGRGQPRCPPVMADRSDGRPMINQEYGISAVFPAGTWVCPAMSGGHHHGLYTRVGEGRFACPPPRDTPTIAAYGAWADYNAGFARTLDAFRTCKGDPAKVRGPSGRALTLKGLDARTCRVTRPDGLIEITLEAFAGTWGPSPDPEANNAPAVVYSAFLSTTPDRFDADLAVFERFLDDLVLTPVPLEGEPG